MNANMHSTTALQAPQSDAEAPPCPQAPQHQSLLDAARAYAQAGLDVYPVWQHAEGGRKPKAPACGHGYKDATRDDATIASWWAPGTSFGVAIRTGLIPAGKHSGKYLVVVDMDRSKREGDSDGESTLQSWLDGEIDGVTHMLPETLEATSWSGGKHLYYASDTPRGCTANADLHIDVRCTGGGIVAAPTRITARDGRSGSYEWVGGFDIDRIAKADAEVEALLDLIFTKKPKCGKTVYEQDDGDTYVPYITPKHVGVGGRHDALVRHAAHLQALGFADAEIARRMHDFCERVCEQPEGDEVTEDELWGVIVWALSKPKGSELARRLTVIGSQRHDGVSESDLRKERGGDAPSDEDERVQRYVRSTIDAYEVYEKDEKGKTTFHPERLTDAFLYGLHACTIDGAPAIWDGRKYIFGISKIAYFMEIACPGASAAANAGALKKIRARLGVERRFDLPSPSLVRFENCVYDCKSGELMPVGQDSWRSRIPNPIPHPLDLAAPPVEAVTKYLELLSDGHEDVQRNLLQTLFLAMARFTHHEQMICLLGDGANGKSKFVDMILAIVGADNASFLSLSRMGSRFEIGDLAGSTVNFSSDISAEYLSGDGASTWKQITGHDVIKTDVKNQDGFAFRPYCQVIVVGNSFPRIEGGIDKAVSRRIHIIPFTHSFRDANGEYSSDADPEIVEKMGDPASVAYLIRLAMEEGQRMLAQREFRLTPNYASRIEVQKLAIDNSSVLAWIDHVSLKDVDLHMQRRKTVYERYASWCKRSALRPMAVTRFIEELRMYFPDLELDTKRATHHDADESGLLGPGRMVQYRAFSILKMAEADQASGTHYVEITGRREVATSVSYSDSGDRRENCRVEEVSFGVLPASSLPKPLATGQITVPQAWWDDIERFEG